MQAERDWAASFRASGLTDAWGARNLREAHRYFLEVAPLQGWSTQRWHREWAVPLIRSQRSQLAQSPTGQAKEPSRLLPPFPAFAAADARPLDQQPSTAARAALALNVVGLGFAVAAVTPIAAAVVVAPMTDAAVVAASATL